MKIYLPLLFAFLLLAACSPAKKAKRLYGDAFLSHWTHSHEDDMDGKKVYRPATYDFPPARGREGFELMPDGKLVYYAIAPADGTLEKLGTWTLKGKDELIFIIDGKESSHTIVSVSGEKLIFK